MVLIRIGCYLFCNLVGYNQIINDMNALRNRVQLIGRVGNTPETMVFEKGKKMVKLSMATNEVYYNEKGEKVETTQWHQLVAWDKLADIFEKYLTVCTTANFVCA